MRDIYKVIIKDFIELFFYNCIIDQNIITRYFQTKSVEHNIPLIEEVVNLFRRLSLEYDNFIIYENSIKGEIFKLKIEFKNLFDICEKYNGAKVEFDKSLRSFPDINRKFLKIETQPIKVLERDTKGFNHFIRIIETNFTDIDNIIIVKKISNWDESEVIMYSAILIMDKPIGYIVYYIEECSFSYEGPFTVQKLIDFMKENDIPVIFVETDDEPIAQNMEFIFDKVDKFIY